MPAPQPVLDLIANFAEHLDAYKSGALNETQVRRDFIDPLFSHLGWDMDNKAGYAEAYRDVVHEDKVQVRTGSRDQINVSTTPVDRRTHTFCAKRFGSDRRGGRSRIACG